MSVRDGLGVWRRSRNTKRTSAGLKTFKEKIVLIEGGYDKHLDYEQIEKPIIENVSTLILLGQTEEKIEEAEKKEMKNVYKEKNNVKDIEIINVKTLEEAVQKAKEKARKEEIILFSPASASFDMFKIGRASCRERVCQYV